MTLSERCKNGLVAIVVVAAAAAAIAVPLAGHEVYCGSKIIIMRNILM